MNVLFLTMLDINSIDERGIYADLLSEFVKNEHNVFILSPLERRKKTKSKIIKKKNITIIKVKTLNLQKTSLIEKGLGQLLLGNQFLNKIRKTLSSIKFDLVLFSTPPITFSNVVYFIKKRDNAFAYLLLKDIFPQNAVDLKMIKKGGFLHKYFLKKEKKLYEVSDKIGCMSLANKKYLLKHNPYLDIDKVEINPNSIKILSQDLTKLRIRKVRTKYNLPLDKKIFVYGGNLGKPQGLDFLLEIIEKSTNNNVYFLIIGSGTEFEKIKYKLSLINKTNATLFNSLPKKEYDNLLKACDVGMIFLHRNFTIPNFPSRLLSYLEMRMPIFAATDSASDIGAVVEEGKCGYWVLSGDIKQALNRINNISNNEEKFIKMKINSRKLIEECYKVEYSYNYIINSSKTKNV